MFLYYGLVSGLLYTFKSYNLFFESSAKKLKISFSVRDNANDDCQRGLRLL